MNYALRIFNRLACIGGPRSRVRSDATDIAEEAEAEIAGLRADLDRECNAGAELLAAWTASQARCAALEAALRDSSDIMREAVRGFVSPARIEDQARVNDALIVSGHAPAEGASREV